MSTFLQFFKYYSLRKSIQKRVYIPSTLNQTQKKKQAKKKGKKLAQYINPN